jgi:uncharacterized protein with NAD-binding domain and iron-sulfur cluster
MQQYLASMEGAVLSGKLCAAAVSSRLESTAVTHPDVSPPQPTLSSV